MEMCYDDEKPSLQTKVGTEAAINQLDVNVIHINPDLLLANGKAVPFTSRESLKDAIINVSQWCDAIFGRVFAHNTLRKMSRTGSIPVVRSEEHTSELQSRGHLVCRLLLEK